MKLKYHIPTDLKITKSFLFRAILILCFFVFIIQTVSAVPPVISIVNNSKTLDDRTGIVLFNGIFVNISESINFNASTTDATNTWHWYRDGVAVVNNFDNYTTSWSTGAFHYIQVNATNIDGTSNNLTWGINVYPAMATIADQIVLLNETPSENVATAIESGNITEITTAAISIYVNIIGFYFYAFVWFIAFGMMWVKQQSINIPTIIGVVFGGILVTFLPPQYQLVSQVLIVFGIFAVVYVFYRGRG